MSKKILGLLRVLSWHLQTTFHVKLAQLEQEFVTKWTASPQPTERERSFVLMVGFVKTGKTTYARQTYGQTHAIVSTDDMHDRLNAIFSELQDDGTVTSRAYWPRQILTVLLRERVVRRLVEMQGNVVIDACNLHYKQRRSYLQMAKRAGYKTKIVWVHCDEEVLRERLNAVDAERQRQKLPATYGKLYAQQIRVFQVPIVDDVDSLECYNTSITL